MLSADMLKAKFYTEKMWNSAPSDVRLVAAKDIHFEPDAERSGNPDAVSRFVTNCLSGIAWAVLIIAFLNFANFAIAEAPLRMRRVKSVKRAMRPNLMSSDALRFMSIRSI